MQQSIRRIDQSALQTMLEPSTSCFEVEAQITVREVLVGKQRFRVAVADGRSSRDGE